jgi:hypothetical protein
MTSKTKRLTVCLCALLLAAATTQSLRADVDFLAVDGTAHLSSGDTVAVVTGSVLCTAGDTLGVSVALVQTRGQTSLVGSGNVGGIACLGVRQFFAVPVDILIPLDGTFKKGPSSAVVSAFTSDGMGGFDNFTDSVAIHVSK